MTWYCLVAGVVTIVIQKMCSKLYEYSAVYCVLCTQYTEHRRGKLHLLVLSERAWYTGHHHPYGAPRTRSESRPPSQCHHDRLSPSSVDAHVRLRRGRDRVGRRVRLPLHAHPLVVLGEKAVRFEPLQERRDAVPHAHYLHIVGARLQCGEGGERA